MRHNFPLLLYQRKDMSKGELTKIFKSMCKSDESGNITPEELSGYFDKYSITLPEEDINECFSKYGLTEPGKMTLQEFLLCCGSITESTLIQYIEAFNLFDRDNDGYISKSDLKIYLTSLGEDVIDQDIDNIFKEVNPEEDGLINFDEFCKMLE